MITATTDNKSTRRFITAIEQFRELDPNIQATSIVVFMAAASRPGATARELSQTSGITEYTLSRTLAALSETHRNGQPGLDLLTRKENPTDARNKQIYLKEKGVALYKRILALTGD
ncbi:MarR family winged helix-turn-helix transcriptional regulator [Neorhizobium sp. S3-V5DH]|uniref:MarR family winged helix-turn-helix transcriptional regulator n=1 Tax=Neorhizobium sp. S3-V5DH TaxID=2485166 RepID=UPI00104A54C1|nr:MarR family winged helix-turn-helix transcriptional regulator [Neorhizobium sp. S3-V5DH]TCV62284.1 DNA-binding MarR family transcriptional regulator [Neorhizobium sp. S3-V5DH]